MGDAVVGISWYGANKLEIPNTGIKDKSCMVSFVLKED